MDFGTLTNRLPLIIQGIQFMQGLKKMKKEEPRPERSFRRNFHPENNVDMSIMQPTAVIMFFSPQPFLTRQLPSSEMQRLGARHSIMHRLLDPLSLLLLQSTSTKLDCFVDECGEVM